MATFPLASYPTRVVSASRASSSPTNVNVTAAAVSHTKGATWTTLIASLPFDTTHIDLIAFNTAVASTATSLLLDIGVGAATAEEVVIPNINCGYLSATRLVGRRLQMAPFSMAAGTRVAARCQALIASDVVTVTADFYGGETKHGLELRGVYKDYGTDLTTSKGVAVASSATVNTKGAWTPITASTILPIKMLMVEMGGNAATNLEQQNLVIDIGVGPDDANTTIICPDVYYELITTTDEVRPHITLIPLSVNIPIGSRIVARIARSVTAAASFDIIVHGIS